MIDQSHIGEASHKDIAHLLARMAKLEKLRDAQRCPDCPDRGWYMGIGDHGEATQVQCEWCYATPNSFFNLLAALDEEEA